MSDDPDHDERVSVSTSDRTSVSTSAISSAYKVLGEFTDTNGAGVLGQNNASSGTPIGVEGAVPNASGGYGLYTVDDAGIDGSVATVEAWQVDVDGERGLELSAPGSFSAGSTQYSTGGNVRFGHLNQTEDGAVGTSIGGGGLYDETNDTEIPNVVTDHFSTIGGGYGNIAGNNDGDPLSALGATVGGGVNNIAGGPNATVGGGNDNDASGSDATIGGGDGNTASNLGDTVAGGTSNTASGSRSSIGGGIGNSASAHRTTIAGGYQNTASTIHATVGGGTTNEASGESATVPGGANNIANGQYSFAAGRAAEAVNDGAFVWSDSGDTSFSSTGTDQFLVDAAGGVGIGTDTPSTQVDVDGSVSVSETGAAVYLGNQDLSVPFDTLTKVEFDTVESDPRNEFDLTDHSFTPDVEGDYLVNAQVKWSGLGSDIPIDLRMENDGFRVVNNQMYAGGSHPTQSISKFLPGLGPSDVISIHVKHSEVDETHDIWDGSWNTYASFVRIG